MPPPAPYADVPSQEGEPVDWAVAGVLRVRFPSVDQLVVAYASDMSDGTLFVHTARLFPVESYLRLLLTVPERSDIVVLARVLQLEEADSSGAGSGMRLELLDLGDVPLASKIAQQLAESESKPQTVRANVLVVDDQESHRSYASKVLAGAGYRVREAKDGLQALAAALQDPPDLVLTDVEMPNMDGWSFVRMLRARTQFRGTRIIFLTALADEAERLHGYRLGVDDYIAKPVTGPELLEHVEDTIHRVRREERGGAAALRGELSKVSLASLLGFLEMERKTGRCVVLGPAGAVTVDIFEGAIVRVDAGKELAAKTPLERLLHVLSWREGRFEVRDEPVTPGPETPLNIMNLLLEHARLTDEQDR